MSREYQIKPNRISLETDQYGKQCIKIQMLTLYRNGKYIKHLKINENTLEKFQEALQSNYKDDGLVYTDLTEIGDGYMDYAELIEDPFTGEF